ncbi:MAG TPA: hypothetical protein VGD55_00555 [Acidothermaceae bacterium]
MRVGLSKLEARVETATKQLARLEGGTEKFGPMLTSVMREGIPLEVFTRMALADSGYKVHGRYLYKFYNSDGWIERSVDVYATQERTFTVPPDGGRQAGESWPERDHLLVEAKQRRNGVTWIFCHLPSSEKNHHFAPRDVPHVNFGYELRPGEHGPKPTGNTKDVENGLAQLEYAYIPKMVDVHNQWKTDHQHLGPRVFRGNGVRRDSTWALLVTNARLMLFKPPATLAELEQDPPPRDDRLFVEAPWLVYQSQPSLHLLGHQATHVGPLRGIPEGDDIVLPVLMADQSCQVHIVNYNHLPRFLRLVEDPPRIKKIVVQLSVDGKESPPFKIEP